MLAECNQQENYQTLLNQSINIKSSSRTYSKLTKRNTFGTSQQFIKSDTRYELFKFA